MPQLIDLSMAVSSQMPVYPGDPEPRMEKVFSIPRDAVNVSSFSMTTHFSTHIDAPYHVLNGGKKLDEYPLEKFTGNGVLLDVRGQFPIRKADPEKIQKDDIVLFYTGQVNKIPDGEYFKLAPFISAELAEKIAERRPKMIGIDSFSPDPEPFEVHKILLKNDILIIENLAGLERLLGKKFDIMAFPLKMSSDGAPARVVAAVK
ncbi:MAG: cyclase family protein [Candidatus Aenigmarchaeota archaeon]|nr:cyclase family protein [Candidatus Aenigmarchaeota archaeon]